MDKLWRLATSMFSIIMGCGLFAVAYILSDGRFNNVLSVLLVYGMLLCVLLGIAKGLLVIWDYHRQSKDKENKE